MQNSGIVEIHVIVKYDRKNIGKVYKESRKIITFLSSNIVKLNRSGKFIVITLIDKNDKKVMTRLKKKQGITHLPAMVCPMYKQKIYGFGKIRIFLNKLSSRSSIGNVGKHLMGAEEEIHAFQMAQLGQAGTKSGGMMMNIDNENEVGMSMADTLVQATRIGQARMDGYENGRRGNMGHRKRGMNNFDPRNKHGARAQGRIFGGDDGGDYEGYDGGGGGGGGGNRRGSRGQLNMQADDPVRICAEQGGVDSDLMAGFWDNQKETKM